MMALIMSRFRAQENEKNTIIPCQSLIVESFIRKIQRDSKRRTQFRKSMF